MITEDTIKGLLVRALGEQSEGYPMTEVKVSDLLDLIENRTALDAENDRLRVEYDSDPRTIAMFARFDTLRAELAAANARTVAAIGACYADAASLAQTMANKWRSEGDTIAGGALKDSPTGKIVINMVIMALESVARMTAEVPAKMGEAMLAHATRDAGKDATP